MKHLARLVVLASGNGSNLQAILDACLSNQLPAQVRAVISDQLQAYALERARQVNIPAIAFPWKAYREKGQDRRVYDADLAEQVSAFDPDYVILAGWMRLLSQSFLERFPMRVINLHPALPGVFPGTGAIERAWQAFQAGEIQNTGVMVHFVPDEGVDNGPLIATETVSLVLGESLERLTERVHHVEHRLLVAAIQSVLQRDAETIP